MAVVSQVSLFQEQRLTTNQLADINRSHDLAEFALTKLRNCLIVKVYLLYSWIWVSFKVLTWVMSVDTLVTTQTSSWLAALEPYLRLRKVHCKLHTSGSRLSIQHNHIHVTLIFQWTSLLHCNTTSDCNETSLQHRLTSLKRVCNVFFAPKKTDRDSKSTAIVCQASQHWTQPAL